MLWLVYNLHIFLLTIECFSDSWENSQKKLPAMFGFLARLLAEMLKIPVKRLLEERILPRGWELSFCWKMRMKKKWILIEAKRLEEDVQKETHNTEALRGEDPLQRLSIKSALLEDENEEETTNYYLKPNLWRKKMFRMQLLMPKLLYEIPR